MEYPRGDMYEIGLWEEMVGRSGDDLVFAINIPQEAVTIPETIDAVRAAPRATAAWADADVPTNIRPPANAFIGRDDDHRRADDHHRGPDDHDGG